MPWQEVMHKWKHGKLHSGSKSGPPVKSQKQAVAIMLSEKAKGTHARAFGGGMPMGPGISGPMGAMPGQAMPNMPGMPMYNGNNGIAGPQPMPTSFRQLALGGVATPGVGNFNMAKSANLSPSPMQRAEDRNLMHGPVNSAVPGRTDAHKVAVPSGSYVIPADVVSARGQGNTKAGMNVLQQMFRMGPYGAAPGAIHPGRTMPRGMAAPKMQNIMASRGGSHGNHVGKPVPVDVAGGELIVPPHNLMQTVHPNLETAHEIMDKWVVNERKKHIKTLAKLPGPVKD